MILIHCCGVYSLNTQRGDFISGEYCVIKGLIFNLIARPFIEKIL